MPLTEGETRLVDQIVEAYATRIERFTQLVGVLQGIFVDNKKLKPYVHSMRWRVKDPSHLKDKLERKVMKAHAEGKIFDITVDNVFEKINDLAGFRILHLYTRQFQDINRIILEELEEAKMPLVEGPTARTWDDESRKYFEEIGVGTKESGETLYTSVHYIVEANTRTKYTAEIQVRTLAEELWGEVDHTINYPRVSPILACREQIKVLARVTSSCSRLVDAVFLTHADAEAPRLETGDSSESKREDPQLQGESNAIGPVPALPRPARRSATRKRKSGRNV